LRNKIFAAKLSIIDKCERNQQKNNLRMLKIYRYFELITYLCMVDSRSNQQNQP